MSVIDKITNEFKEQERKINHEIDELKNIRYENFYNVKTLMKYAAVQFIGLASSTGMTLKQEDEEKLKKLLANDGDVTLVNKSSFYYCYNINENSIILPFQYNFGISERTIGRIGFVIDRDTCDEVKTTDHTFNGYNVNIYFRQVLGFDTNSGSDVGFANASRLMMLMQKLLDLSIKFDDDLKNKFKESKVYECKSSLKLEQLKKKNNEIVDKIPHFWDDIKKSTKFMRKGSKKIVYVNTFFIKIYDTLNFNVGAKQFKITQTQSQYAKNNINLERIK